MAVFEDDFEKLISRIRYLCRSAVILAPKLSQTIQLQVGDRR